jgi:hypothetical protein
MRATDDAATDARAPAQCQTEQQKRGGAEKHRLEGTAPLEAWSIIAEAKNDNRSHWPQKTCKWDVRQQEADISSDEKSGAEWQQSSIVRTAEKRKRHALTRIKNPSYSYDVRGEHRTMRCDTDAPDPTLRINQ